MLYKLTISISGVLLLFGALKSNAQDTIFDDFTNPVISDSLWEKADRTWSAGNPPVHGGVVPELVSYKDGFAIIEGHGDQYTGTVEGHGRNTRVGACLISKEKYASGSYEIKAKILPREGALSAFWTFDYEAYSNPDSGNINHEIDIEIKKADGAFNQAYCNTWTYEKVFTHRINNQFYNQDDGNFHTYRFDWHTGGDTIQPRVEFYYDNELKETIETTIPNRPSKFWMGVWFPTWAGTPDFDTDTLWIDYVKIIPFHEPNDAFENDTTSQRPYYGEPFSIPCKIEAEDFDLGSNGDAYYDSDNGNTGKAYRLDTDVDIEAWTGLGYALGYVVTDEWVEYSIDVSETKPYHVYLKTASKLEGGTMHIEIDGTDITGLITIPGTGGWGIFDLIKVPEIDFPAGEHIMRVYFDSGDFNLDYISILDTSTVISSINKNEIQGIHIYPSPCKGQFTIQNNSVFSGQAQMQIINNFGKICFKKPVYLNQKSSFSIDLPEGFPKGFYIVSIQIQQNTLQYPLLIQ